MADEQFDLPDDKSKEVIPMRLPEFTAEASLGKMTKDYVLRSEERGNGGGVLPQGLFVDQNGNIWYCDEIVGCTQVGHVRRAVFF